MQETMQISLTSDNLKKKKESKQEDMYVIYLAYFSIRAE